MRIIYPNLASLDDQFDCLIFDAYGVFYDGADFYAGVLDYMADLIKKGKKVIVLSNGSQTVDKTTEKYKERGLFPDQHYNFFVTSGQVFREDAEKNQLPVRGQRYFMIGQKSDTLSGLDFYRQVMTPEEADFVFLSVPYLTKSEIYQGDKTSFLPAKADKQGKIIYWDTTKIDPFLPIIEKCVRLKLPAITANPDFYASEKHPDRTGVTFVVRNGLLAEYYRRFGGVVAEYGKPNRNVYDYVFRQIGKSDSSRTAMIGDTIRTDICGAIHAGISPVLCLETGVTADALAHGESLETLLDQSNIKENQLYFIRRVV